MKKHTQSRWQLHLEEFGLHRLAPQRVSGDEPPSWQEELEQEYTRLLRRREHWLAR